MRAILPAPTRWLLTVAGLETIYLLLQFLDAPLYAAAREWNVADRSLFLIKNFGALSVWVAVAAGLVLYDWRRLKNGWRRVAGRGTQLLGGALFAGLAAEILKLLVRRERSQEWFAALPNYREWSGAWWENNDLGMPSSHAATAFGAAIMLAKLFPAGAAWWYGLATACAVSRVVAQAHTPTEVYAGAVVAWLVTRAWLRAIRN
ncbi:MAG: phosphatase PAP2 family protein [Planctomycetota bacterium]|jgi:membrane-associated phospholipid phosphatase|nr:phosphatase PAP2 family protein [Planctomycetota bacterium]